MSRSQQDQPNETEFHCDVNEPMPLKRSILGSHVGVPPQFPVQKISQDVAPQSQPQAERTPGKHYGAGEFHPNNQVAKHAPPPGLYHRSREGLQSSYSASGQAAMNQSPQAQTSGAEEELDTPERDRRVFDSSFTSHLERERVRKTSEGGQGNSRGR